MSAFFTFLGKFSKWIIVGLVILVIVVLISNYKNRNTAKASGSTGHAESPSVQMVPADSVRTAVEEAKASFTREIQELKVALAAQKQPVQPSTPVYEATTTPARSVNDVAQTSPSRPAWMGGTVRSQQAMTLARTTPASSNHWEAHLKCPTSLERHPNWKSFMFGQPGKEHDSLEERAADYADARQHEGRSIEEAGRLASIEFTRLYKEAFKTDGGHVPPGQVTVKFLGSKGGSGVEGQPGKPSAPRRQQPAPPRARVVTR